MSLLRSILTLNVGSSNLKFALFDAAPYGRRILRGEAEDLAGSPQLRAADATGVRLIDRSWPSGAPDPIAAVLQAVLETVDRREGEGALCAVGHRVVQGGADHLAPEIVTPALLEDLRALTPLDPLHLPSSLKAMRTIGRARPALVQVACYDTAFHRTLPAVATRFALPRDITQAGVRRYGFHGLSYEFVTNELAKTSAKLVQGRVVAAHLGSGASLCALQSGRSVATTTGFSTIDGLMMATRCGSLDPGVIFHLGRQGRSLAEIEVMLLCRSGLLGVSGISGDVRVLLASDDPHAREAIELFTYRIACETGSMASALGGLDGFVFTGGIGEHAPAVRAAVCDRLGWLGLRLDPAANALGRGRISTFDSAVEVHVIATDEEAMIASHTRATLAETSAPARAA